MSRWLQNLAFVSLPVSFLRRHFAKISTEISPATNTRHQLLIDMSVISKVDAKTGIQRVVRNLYQELLAAPPAGYTVCAIAATRNQGYCYLPTDFLRQSAEKPISTQASVVHVRAGDLFLGLDLAAHIVPHRVGELLYWKRQGVRLCFLLYDLLPVLEPTWFNPKTTKNFRRWLRAIAILADNIVAISCTVQAEFSTWIRRNYGLNEWDLPCVTIQLGAELSATTKCRSATQRLTHLPAPLIQNKFVLIVGTIEPRKGHADVVNAFEQIWAKGDQTNLVIAGKQGWKVESLVHHLQTHPEAGKRLHWLNGPSDEVLPALYENCSGLIMASKGEGLGLPLIEAAYFGKPVLVRDIPVFREIIGDAGSYFPAAGGEGLMRALSQWLMRLEANDQVLMIRPTCVTWRESSAQLIRKMLPDINCRRPQT